MENPTTIFISAYRNFSIRYILYSDIFKELKKTGARIVVFLKDKNVDYYRKTLSDKNIIIEPIFWDQSLRLLKENRINVFFNLVRRFISGSDNKHNNTTDNIMAYQTGKEFNHSLLSIIKFKTIKTLSALGKKNKLFRKLLIKIESVLSSGKLYDQYFKKYKPSSLIISSIGYMIDPFFMRAAKRHKCKVVSIIHSWDNPTTKGYRGSDPDHVIVWNEIMKHEVEIFHDISEKNIFIGGIAHWDSYFNGKFKPLPKEKFLKMNNLSSDKKIIFFGTSNYKIFHNTFDVIENLLNAISKGKMNCPTQLIVRLHPEYLASQNGKKSQVVENYYERMENIKKNYEGLISFNLPMMKFLEDDIDMPVEDMHHLANILYYSDVLLTEYSTLAIEAAIFNLPIINVGLYNYRDTSKPASYIENFTHIRRLLKTGATRNAYNYEQLYNFINLYLEDRSNDEDKRRQLKNQEITTNAGNAGIMIGRYLNKIITSNSQEKINEHFNN